MRLCKAFSAINVIVLLLAAEWVYGAPSRQLTDVTGPLPIGQWFKNKTTQAVSKASKEFYDNIFSGSFPSPEWGGWWKSDAIYGTIGTISYDATGKVTGFTIDAFISNDTYAYAGVLTQTTGTNSHFQTAPNVAGQSAEVMFNTRLTASFADAGLGGTQYSNIRAVNYDELAWYCTSSSEPPQHVLPTDGDYRVPTWRFGDIAVGASAYRELQFALYSPAAPGSQFYLWLHDAYNNWWDVLANRTKSLKISKYPDSLFQDNGTAWPAESASNCSDVSVFYDLKSYLAVERGSKTPFDHYWWNGLPATPNEMLQMKATAGQTEPVKVYSVTLKASGTGNDQTDITSIRVVLDANQNGIVDPGEALLGSGTYPTDDGTRTIAFSSPYTIAAGASAHFIVAYVMSIGLAEASTYELSVTAVDARSAVSGDPVMVWGLELASCTKTVLGQAPTKVTIGQAKLLPAGTLVMLENESLIGQGCYGTELFIEEQDRSAGIRVVIAEPAEAGYGEPDVSIGDVITVVGWIEGPGDAEARIRMPGIVRTTGRNVLRPIGMNNRWSGGASFGLQEGVIDVFNDPSGSPPLLPTPAFGLSSIGMLVRAWGTVTYSDDTQIWIDDGSSLWDGTIHPQTQIPVLGICVTIPSEWTQPIPAVGSYVGVTGIMRCRYQSGVQSGSELPIVRWLQPREPNEISILRTPSG